MPGEGTAQKIWLQATVYSDRCHRQIQLDTYSHFCGETQDIGRLAVARYRRGYEE